MEAFLPWVGYSYKDSPLLNCRLLILAESIYCEDYDDCKGCFPGSYNLCNYRVIHGIQKNICGETSAPLYTKIYRLIVEEESTSKEVFWNNVSFYNYVQTAVAKEARIRPSKEMWDISEKPFREVLKMLQPDKLIVFGDQLWDNLPGKVGVDWIRVNDASSPIYSYNYDNGKLLALPLKHPQAPGFDYSDKIIINQFITQKFA